METDLIGIVLFALVSRITFLVVYIFVYGMALPSWIILALILPHLITFPIGGYLGFKMGNKVKNVMESV